MTGRDGGAEEALKESEANYSALIEDLPELVCRSAPDLTRLYVNEGYCRYFGKSREELIGRSFLDQLPEEDHGPLREHLASLSYEEPVGSFEHRVWRHDGEVRWQQWTNRAIYDEDGDLTGYQAVGRDFNVRKQAEEALKESEERFRGLTDAAFEGIAICDEDGKVLEVNRAFADMFGCGIPEVRGTDVHEFYVPEEREKVRREIPSGPDGPYEAVGHRKDGTTFDLEVRGRVASRGDSTVRISVLRDVTERKHVEKALRESEERYRAVVEQAAEGIVLVNADDRRLIEANPEFRHVFGYAAEEVVGLPLYDLVIDDPRSVDRNIELVLREGSHTVGGRRFRRKDGTPVEVTTSGSAVEYGGRRVVCIVIRDVTDQKEAERALRESEERFRALAENASDVITVLEVDGIIRYESRAVERVLGYEPGERVGQSAFEHVHPDDAEKVRATFGGIVARGEPTGTTEFRFRHKDGSWRRLEAVGRNLISDPDVRGVVVTSRDVTERKILEDRLHHQAFHDLLTGLPNRALLMDRLGRALSHAEQPGGENEGKVAILLVDLDDFKYVNDSLGHFAGDRLLVAAAGRLEGCLWPGDTVARLGGDEFAVLLAGAKDARDATHVAEKIAEALRKPFSLGDREMFVGASVGIAFGAVSGVPGGGRGQPEDLLRKADLALYDAKRGGKARHALFDPETERRATRRLELQNGLRRALERGELAVRYQPVVSLKTGRTAGFEALVRWEHPERGLVLPPEFVPLAEETGLIVGIGRYVLREACRRAKEWPRRRSAGGSADLFPIVGVNLSARQLSHPDLVGDVEGVLKETGLEPERLTLEITESAVVGDEENGIGVLGKLKDLGVKLAIDDFGTGYSSLSYLRRLPVGMVKLDGSFVAGIGKGAEEDEVLLEGVVGIAKGLGLRVLAEGVETSGQAARLHELGCDLAQGFLFARPLTAEVATDFLGPWYPNG